MPFCFRSSVVQGHGVGEGEAVALLHRLPAHALEVVKACLLHLCRDDYPRLMKGEAPLPVRLLLLRSWACRERDQKGASLRPQTRAVTIWGT